ncbi:MAG TPA: glycine oxidase ThiO [Mycobacteriales bacterium]|nr:glycine oxidase ThiO [Mycobacteriales bacterium]
MSVAVVGGGVIGLSVAWKAATAGHDVELIDPAPGSGASHVAGGMLAPVTEAWPGEEELLELGAASLRRWPEFAAGLEDEEILNTAGTVVAAVDSADLAELDRLAAYLAGIGRDVDRLGHKELRSLEPGLGPAVRGGLCVPGDICVDNRALLTALRKAGAKAGVRVVESAATSVRSGLVTLAGGSRRPYDIAIISAGAWSGSLHPALAGRIRPVKGEILRLRARRFSLPPPTRTVRALVEGPPVYLVPRAGRGLVVGATQYEAGFDSDVTVEGVRDLLRTAESVVPAIADYALLESAAGLRPATSDNLPVIEELEPGVIAATGHFRNGILLAPITAEKVLELLA